LHEATAGLTVRISHRLERVLGERVYLLILAALIGVLGGFGAVVFRWLIDAFNALLFPGGFSLDALVATPWYLKVIPPAVGGLLAGPLVYFLAREAKGHGIPEVMDSVANRGGRIRKRVMLVKTLASAITIGSGGSAGREGPIVQIGAGIGSSVGQVLGFEGQRLVVVLGCGAAAGMAATFNAPIAGVLFAMEIIIGTASISVFSPLVVASVMGTMIARFMLVDEPAFVDVPGYSLVNPLVELPLYVILGGAAGMVALMFTHLTTLIEDFWTRVPLPGWVRPAIGGAIVGATALIFPHVLGAGYETISELLRGEGVIWMVAALVVVKTVATGMTLGSGGSGGVFAPSLFVGACLGGAFGMALELVLPGQTAGPGAYALVGMGAVVAGTTHAPLTAILVLFEMTGNYTIILPLMITCIISTVLASRISRSSVYTIKLLRRGVRLRGSSEADLMRSTRVRRILRPFPESMPPDTPISEVTRKALNGSMAHQYVVDGEGRPVGVITLRSLKSIFGERDLDDALLVAADVMKSPVASVSLDDTLDIAMAHISRLDTEMLPVVDADGRLVGCVTRHDMMVFFEHEIMRDGTLGMKFVADGAPEEAQFVELPEGHGVRPLEVTRFLAGKTLRELDLRATADLNVLGIRRKTPEGIERLAPDPRRKLVEGEILLVVGPADALESFRKAITDV
jgi:CIC family chloride channel protein